MLLAAVFLSFQNMNDGVKNAPPDELARLRGQIEQLRVEQERTQLERQLQDVRLNPVPEVSSPSDIQMMKDQLAAKEAEIAELAAEKSEAEKKAATYRDEAGMVGQRELEKKDDELRRARLIGSALLIGRVTEYVNNPEFGNFATIEVVLPEHVQVDTILAIRRNTGILGRVKITSVTAEGAIGSPMPGFGPVVPEPGDDLIIPQQY